MGFENFGVISFTSETKVGDFVKYLEQGKIMGTKCPKCGAAYFPPRMECKVCFSEGLIWFEVTGTGQVLTYSTVNYAPKGFENDTPYTIALAEFPGGVRALSRISRDIAEKDIAVGMKVKAAPVRLAGSRISYEFQRPA